MLEVLEHVLACGNTVCVHGEPTSADLSVQKSPLCGPAGYGSVSLNPGGYFRGALKAKAPSLFSNIISALGPIIQATLASVRTLWSSLWCHR